MKLLILFADMIRRNRLSTFSDGNAQPNELDQIIQKIGGDFYTNCFAVAPDTPRSLATLYTGVEPQLNGCDRHTKWPQHFLKKNVNNIFKDLADKDYTMDFLSDPVERMNGIFPQFVMDNYNHNTKYSVREFFNKLVLKEKHLVFACFPQFHWTIDALGASTYGERQGYKNISFAMQTMLDEIDIQEFDHVFLFSDHGFKLSYELRTNPIYTILNEDRTNVLFLHKQKDKNKLKHNNMLCSLVDFKKLLNDICSDTRKSNRDYTLPKREYIVIEDHKSFNVGIYDPIELWALKTKTAYYIRDADFGFCRKPQARKFDSIICKSFDEILLDNAEFRFVQEVQRLRHIYKKTVKKDFIKKNNIYDHRQIKISSVKRNFYKFMDFIKYCVMGR